jgi:hypothetical protein
MLCRVWVMIGYFVRWIMAIVIHGPFAGVHATVRGRLYRPEIYQMPCSVLDAMCVCRDEGGVRRGTDLIYIIAVQLGMHTHHLYMLTATCSIQYQSYLHCTTTYAQGM